MNPSQRKEHNNCTSDDEHSHHSWNSDSHTLEYSTTISSITEESVTWRRRNDTAETLNAVGHSFSRLSEQWKMNNETARRIDRLAQMSIQDNQEQPLRAQPNINRGSRSRTELLPVAPPTPKISREHQVVPYMYKAALTHDWADVICRAITYPMEASYIHAEDGSTVLHLALISRASSANCISIDGQLIRKVWDDNGKSPAPLEVIRALLEANPDAAKLCCKRLGYTPLIYALLQPRDETRDFESESLVRLLLDYSERPSIPSTASGLTPLGVHITSFSQANGSQQFATTNEAHAESTTKILRVLLDADSSANGDQDKQHHSQHGSVDTGNCLEVLYECNASAILDAVECASISSSKNNTLSLSDLKCWWLWRWLMLILEHSVARTWIRGPDFSATHAAAALENGCPLPLLMLLVRSFPDQVKSPCPMSDTNRSVLHSVCCWGGREPRNDDAVNFSRKQMAISNILREYPAAAATTDAQERTPLCVALENRTMWNGGVSKLYKAFPGAVNIQDQQTGLYPFMTAAAASPQNGYVESAVAKSEKVVDPQKDLLKLRTIFELLRAAPEVLFECLGNNDETDSWLEFRRAAQQQSLTNILQHFPAPGLPFQSD